MAAGSGLGLDTGELDCHLYRIPPILLRHEEARNQPRQTSLEGPSPAISSLDYSFLLHPFALDWWLCHFPARTVSQCHCPNIEINTDQV